MGNSGTDIVLPRWDTAGKAICARIRAVRAPMKIVLKIRNEADHLDQWVRHHARIVGEENLVIADNDSDDEATLRRLARASGRAAVFRFGGNHTRFHERRAFPELYAALCASCDHFTVLDADERLVWIEDGRWFADAGLPGRIAALAPFDLLPGSLLWNEIARADAFRYDGSDQTHESLVSWGKPVVSSSARPGPAHMCHNIQFPAGCFRPEGASRLFQLHLARLHPERRIAANVEKLVAHGYCARGDSLEAILAKGRRPGQRVHPSIDRFLGEIRTLLASPRATPAAGDRPGPDTILFGSDGTIRFASPERAERFADFVLNGASVLQRVFARSAAAKAAAHAAPAAAAGPPGAAAALLAAAEEARRSGDRAAAERHLRAGAEAFPGDRDQYGHPRFRKELMRELLAARRWAEAEALVPGPDDPGDAGWHHILFARALAAEGRKDEAQAHWQAALKAQPGNPEALRALGPQQAPAAAPGGPLAPHMTAPEQALFARHLAGAGFLLEFGAGGSTAFAARLGVKRIVSVESDRAWLDKVARQPEMSAVTFVPVHVNLGPTGPWGYPTDPAQARTWPRYHRGVWAGLDAAPDIVLVDGRFRVACALSSLLETAAGTTIVIHDFWSRAHYRVVLSHLDCVERVDDLGVFRARADLDWRRLARDLVDHALDPR